MRALPVVVILALAVSPAPAASLGDSNPTGIPLQVTPGCSVPLHPALPHSPDLWPSCDGQSTAELVPQSRAVTADPPGPCVAVVPLVDDRCETWSSRFDGPAGGPDYPTSDLGGSRLVAVSPDSATVFAAVTSDSSPSTAAGWDGIDFDLAVVATEADGGAGSWTFRLGGLTQSFAHDIAADPDGDLVYATTMDYADVGTCARGATMVAVDQSTGEQAWSAQETSPQGECFSVWSTAVDPAGERVFLIGTARGADGRSLQTLTARDADTGEPLWTVSAPGPSKLGGTGTALAVSLDGSRVYAGGSVLSDVTGHVTHVAWTLRGYDTATGALAVERIWDAPHPAGQSPANPPAALAVSPDASTLYAVGGVEHVTGRFFDITAVAFHAATGAEQWRYRYDGPRDKSSFDGVWFNSPLAISADGSTMAIAGYSTHLIGANLQLDLATVLLDTADGRQLWATRYTSESETNWVPSVALSPDAATVYVAAPSRYGAKWEAPARYTTLAYHASSGTVDWTARYSDGHSFAQGSALTPDGKRFVVTGMTADAGPQTATGVDWGLGMAAYATD